MSRLSFFGALIAGALTWPSVLSAQGWSLGVDGGRMRSSLDPAASASAVVAARVGYEDLATLLRVSAAVPTGADSVRWLSVGAWRRVSANRGSFLAGLDASGSAFAFQVTSHVARTVPGLFDPLGASQSTVRSPSSGRALAGELLPVVAFTAGDVQWQARSGFSYYDASNQDARHNRVVSVSDLQASFQPATGLALVPVIRHYAPRGESDATFAGLSAMAVAGQLRLLGSVGHWLNAPAALGPDRSAWSVGGELGMAGRVSFSATARHDGVDPLYLSPALTSWSVGLSVLVGPRPRAPAQPVAARYVNGVATIRLPSRLFKSPPRVAGDFNNWTPVAMERDGESWRYAVAASPGVYNYAFVAADGTWYVPDGVPGRKDDGMGGHVAVLVVQ